MKGDFQVHISPQAMLSELRVGKDLEGGLHTTDATGNSPQLRTCDLVPCTLLASNECLTDGICALFNMPLIEVRNEQAKECIKKMKPSWFVSVMAS